MAQLPQTSNVLFSKSYYLTSGHFIFSLNLHLYTGRCISKYQVDFKCVHFRIAQLHSFLPMTTVCTLSSSMLHMLTTLQRSVVVWPTFLLIDSRVSPLGLWSVNFFLIAPFPEYCLLVPFFTSTRGLNGN